MEKAVHLLPHTPDYGHHHHQSFSRHLGHEGYGLQPGKLNSAVYSRTLLILTEQMKLILPWLNCQLILKWKLGPP